MKKDIGIVIKACRNHCGLKQSYVAFKLGITVNSYANIEHGRVELSISKLYLLASLFGLQAHQIVALAEEIAQYRGCHFLSAAIKKMSKA
ncbi:transcriptional regulator, y4mF family [compost metagenome]